MSLCQLPGPGGAGSPVCGSAHLWPPRVSPAASLGGSLGEQPGELVLGLSRRKASATSILQLSAALCQAPHGTHVEGRPSPPLTRRHPAPILPTSGTSRSPGAGGTPASTLRTGPRGSPQPSPRDHRFGHRQGAVPGARTLMRGRSSGRGVVWTAEGCGPGGRRRPCTCPPGLRGAGAGRCVAGTRGGLRQVLPAPSVFSRSYFKIVYITCDFSRTDSPV